MMRPLLLALAIVVAVPSYALAQWYVAVYAGGNYTPAADVAIDAPAIDVVLTYEDVRFTGKPLASPQYYGYRLGWMAGERRRVGLELEFVHLKVIADTSREYAVSGRAGGSVLPPGRARMSEIVEQYQMTHGLNFVLVNLVTRTPIGAGGSPRTALVARAGAGPVIPHAETRVAGRSQEQYEYAGVGAHAAAGLDLRLRGRWSALIEYKLTIARPEIELASGTGRMTALTHQVAVGFAFGIAR
jgi:hypothetical protein